jgi:hypothetical protein
MFSPFHQIRDWDKLHASLFWESAAHLKGNLSTKHTAWNPNSWLSVNVESEEVCMFPKAVLYVFWMK